MAIFRTSHTRAELAALLDDPTHDGSALGAVLRAAGGPASRGEVAGLATALAAYRSADAPALSPEFAAAAAPGRRRFVATKLIAAAASAAAVGGVAFAAVTTGQTFSPGTGHPQGGSTSAANSGNQVSRGAGEGNGGDETASDSGKGTPTPSLVGLCKAWEAHQDNRGSNGKSQDSAAFRVLIATAGGVNSVNGFCVSLLATASNTPESTDHPTPPVHPTDTGKPSDVTGGRPSDVTLPPAAGNSTGRGGAARPTGSP